MIEDPFELVKDKIQIRLCQFCGYRKSTLHFATSFHTIIICKECYEKMKDFIEG